MAVYTVKITGQCAGGEHIHCNLLRDGAVVKKKVLTKTELLDSNIDPEQVMIFFLQQAIKASDAKTVTQAKTAIESAQWVF